MNKEGEGMARKARVKDHFGIYYVTQNSSGCRPLFITDEDRNYFIDILQRVVNKFQCKVYEYCVQNDDTYHLIIDVNGGDLSKIMKSINIPYAMYATCEGKLFKDRYKSQPIYNEEELTVIRDRIKEQAMEQGGYSSFCISEIAPCITSPIGECENCIQSMDEAYHHIGEEAARLHVDVGVLLKDKQSRNQLIREIRRNSTLSLKSIGEIFGGLSESTVCKILNKNDESKQ